MTLADAYKVLQHGSLWSSTGKCKGYAVANPGEATKINGYVAALTSALATGAVPPVPPVLATDTGNGIVGMLAAVASHVTGSTPPSPPPSGRIGNGLLLNAQGSSYPALTVAQHKEFGGIITACDKEPDVHALGPPVNGLSYRTVYEVGTLAIQWPSALTAATCRTNGWLYKDGNGHEISLNGGNVCAAIGDPGYQAAFAAALQANDTKTGCRAHFFDNSDGNIWWGVPPVVAGRTMTDADMADALYGFFTYLSDHLPGIYLLPNVGEGYPDRWAWLRRLLTIPGVGGVCIENYTGIPAEVAAVEAIQAAGKDPWLINTDVTDPASALARTRAASFGQVWDGKGGGFGFASGSWAANPNWTSVILE